MQRLALVPAAQDLLFREARTANTFTAEPVSDEQMRAVYDLVKYGPTASNQSPLRIVLIRTPQARLDEGNRAKTASAPLTAILATDHEFHKDAYFSGRPVREESAALNGALQAAYFLIGIRAAGLATGPMTGYDAEGLRKEFLDGDHAPLIIVNIGRPGPDAWFPPPSHPCRD